MMMSEVWGRRCRWQCLARPTWFAFAVVVMTTVVTVGATVSLGDRAYAGVVAQQTPERIELEFWRAIKDSTDPEEFEAYLQAYPKGKFAPLARIRAKSLKKSQEGSNVATPAPAPTPPTPAQPATGTAKVAPSNPSANQSGDLPAGIFRDCGACPEMIEVSAGSFDMGSSSQPESSPVRQVSISYGFAVSRFELTVGQWALCVADGGCKDNSRHESLDPQTPAINLSHVDADDYTRWLSEYTGRTYRLLSETEWEYVARGGSSTTYWWGDTPSEGFANCRDCGGQWEKQFPISGSAFQANGFGVYGLSGGVSEWVADCWNSSYASASSDGAVVASGDCNQRVLRGGSWRNKVPDVTPSSRYSYDRSVRYVTNGVRVALDTNERPTLND